MTVEAAGDPGRMVLRLTGAVRESDVASDVSELRVFLASPGDLTDERSALRALEASLNMLFAGADLRLRVTGWEDLPPGFGRPQGLINPMVDECDVFIGMLRRKWGTDTGEHETGFIEEFERAVARRRAGGYEPGISLYFAQMSKDELDDAGRRCCVGQSGGMAERSPAGESDGQGQLSERRR